MDFHTTQIVAVFSRGLLRAARLSVGGLVPRELVVAQPAPPLGAQELSLYRESPRK